MSWLFTAAGQNIGMIIENNKRVRTELLSPQVSVKTEQTPDVPNGLEAGEGL